MVTVKLRVDWSWMVFLTAGSSDLFLIISCMTSNFLCLSVSTLHSSWFFKEKWYRLFFFLLNWISPQSLLSPPPPSNVFDVNKPKTLSFTFKRRDYRNFFYVIFEIVCPWNFFTWIKRELKTEKFSGRRQLKPDVTSWFVRYCACSCSPHCRRAPVGDVKLVCLALWREREYLTFISIRFVAFSNQNFADYRS